MHDGVSNGVVAMTPRERQVELSKVVAGIEKAVRNREVAALFVVGLRHDGQVTHGTVVTGREYGRLVEVTAEVLRRVGAEVVQQTKGEGEG